MIVEAIEIIELVKLAVEVIQVVFKVVTNIAKALGIIEQDAPEPEELGDKAIQFEAKTGLEMKDFDSPEEYYEKVKEYILDEKKSAETSLADKLAKAIEINSALIMMKYSGFPVNDLIDIVIKHPTYFTENRISEIGKVIVQNSDFPVNLVDYCKGNIKETDKLSTIEECLENIEKVSNPGISKDDIEKNITSIKEE